MQKIRINQLLKIYRQSYANKESWKQKRFEALKAQRPHAAKQADGAAWYWENTQQKLYIALLINPL